MRGIVFVGNRGIPDGPIPRGLLAEARKRGYKTFFSNHMDGVEKCSEVIVFTNRAEKVPLIEGPKVGWWMCDLRTPSEQGELEGRVDKIFLCNTEYTDQYEEVYGAPVSFVPQPGMTSKLKRGRHIMWDVIFLGNFNPTWHWNRYDVISEIEKDYTVKVFSGGRTTPDAKWLYRESPFSLSISLPKRHYTSNRTYNILSAGGFCLINYFPGIEDLFENHKHLVWFHDPEEARELITYYYGHPKDYDMIRREGLRLYKKQHTVSHRLDTMFSLL